MSNYIYNDNFYTSSDASSSPAEKKKSFSTKSVAIICTVCIIFSSIFGLFGGMLAGGGDNGSSAPNTVYTNTVYRGSELASLTESKGSEVTRADIVANIKDTVVEIETQYVVTSYYQYVTGGAGSGVLVGDYEANNGTRGYYIITNAHVIEGANTYEYASSITVTLTDGTEYIATVKGYDPTGDIAVLMIEENERALPCASFVNEDYNLRVGDEVIAIGNPLGQLGGTVTNGYISALDREISIDGNTMNLLQTDAAINPGNSGGGLFNTSGQLVGIVNAKSSGTGIEGLGFAIPANDAFKILTDFINLGYVTGRPTIGVTCSSFGQYVQIVSIKEGLNDTVLQLGDKIIGVRGDVNDAWTSVSSVAVLSNAINKSDIGDTIELYINRGGRRVIVDVVIFEFTA